MATEIGPLNVRRSIWIDATPNRVWQEFETLDRMRRWFGTGHELVRYEPAVGAEVETDAGEHDGEQLRFVGRVLVADPPHELTFEQDWIGHGWPAPPRITLRLTPLGGGTLVELFHHGFEVLGADAAENHRGFEGGWTMRQLDALHDVVALATA
jgi:uncharacterized protein YndB with AHSA1/START domain